MHMVRDSNYNIEGFEKLLKKYISRFIYICLNWIKVDEINFLLAVSLFTDKNRQEQTRTVKNRQEAFF